MIFNVCYHLGVFISRSSIIYFKISSIWLFPCLQLLNCIFWMLNTMFLFVENFYVLFAIMTWVGMMAGGGYVNVIYFILENDALPKDMKELAMTVTTICNDSGILTASLISLALANTVFK